MQLSTRHVHHSACTSAEELRRDAQNSGAANLERGSERGPPGPGRRAIAASVSYRLIDIHFIHHMSYSFAAPRQLCTLTPFLYPSLLVVHTPKPRQQQLCKFRRRLHTTPAWKENVAIRNDSLSQPSVDIHQYDHLDPAPRDYSAQPFTDACALTVSAGAGGHGCVSFLREKYIPNGPPNGGDGGTGGSVYIQAVRGETSLHKIARRGILKAGRGKNGQGASRGGARGEDLLLTVPVGTVVREIWRVDPVEIEHARQDAEAAKKQGKIQRTEAEFGDVDGSEQSTEFRREKWLIYPGTLPKAFSVADFPATPKPRRSHLTSLQPPTPLRLDLDKPMETPMLLAAGAMGGLGNPHFVTKTLPRPKFSTKGEDGMRIHLQLELKLLADVGLVGLPNAGKSTLLRAVTKSRTRVGNWAFTTLSPNIGTVILDTHTGRPALDTKGRRKEPRTQFTIADIPGLIEDAHLDRGLGLGFLRHIERAAVLAFVVDLSARDAVQALQSLWREVGEYEKLREQELNVDTQRLSPNEDGMVPFNPFETPMPDHDDHFANSDGDAVVNAPDGRILPPLSLPPITSKPWFVVATKADLPETQENFLKLQEYLKGVQTGEQAHPSGKQNAWRKTMYSLPVSAINKEGVAGLPEIILELLND